MLSKFSLNFVIDEAFDRMGGSSLKRIAPGERRFTQIDRDS